MAPPRAEGEEVDESPLQEADERVDGLLTEGIDADADADDGDGDDIDSEAQEDDDVDSDRQVCDE